MHRPMLLYTLAFPRKAVPTAKCHRVYAYVHLTSWRAALRFEDLRPCVVLFGEAEVSNLEVGVVLLVHEKQVFRLKNKT